MKKLSQPSWDDNSGYTNCELYPNGNYKTFVPTLDTEWKLGNYFFKLPANHKIDFHESGQLKSFTLLESINLDVHGVSVWTKESTEISIFEGSFKVQKFTVGRQKGWLINRKNWRYRGVKYSESTCLEFGQDGAVSGMRNF